MADDKFTSLLGKSSGTSFGELAGAYMSRGKKKDNRARNIMLGTLLFNIKENKMRSNVMKNLETLENDKVLEQARLNKQWGEREKLQTEYETVKNKGAYNYYKTDAEIAFEESHGADEKYDLKAYQQEKIDWMKDWSSKKEADLNKRYSGVDTDILTKEEFMEPVNAYYRAKQEDYLNPQNTSLVHKALGKIGFGTNRSETTGNFLDKEGEDTVYKFNENRKAHKTRIDNLTSQEVAEIKMDTYKYDKTIKLTDKDFNTILSDNNLLTGTSAEQLRAQRKAYANFVGSNKSYKSAQEAVTSAILGFDIDSTNNQLETIRREYEAVKGPMPTAEIKKENLESLSTSKGSQMFYQEQETTVAAKNWKRGLEREISKSFSIKDLTVDRQNRAEDLFQLGLNSGQYKESQRKEILNKIIGEDLRLATGEPDYNKIRDDIISQKTLETLIILQEDPNESARARRAQAQIKAINFVEKEDKEYLEDELTAPTYKKLQDVNFDMVKFNKQYGTITGPDMSIIRKLQSSLYLTTQTDLAITAGNSIEQQLRDLAGK